MDSSPLSAKSCPPDTYAETVDSSSMTTSADEPQLLRNADCDWETFRVISYVNHNYGIRRAPDLIILERLVAFHRSLAPGGYGIEIGAGPNLYPILAACGLRSKVAVTDVACVNLQYLSSQIELPLREPWRSWYEALLSIDSNFPNIDEVPTMLKDMCIFDQLSILDLPNSTYDYASMHFVAESITNNVVEFEKACQKAVRCIRPGGGFAFSLMLGSQGYSTDDISFPAVSISPEDALGIFAKEASSLNHLILTDDRHRVRDGHSGMIFVSGLR